MRTLLHAGATPLTPPALLAPLLLVASLVSSGCASGRVHARASEEIRRGYAYLESGDLERADVAFAHALEFNPDIPEALNGAAVVARRGGDLVRARRMLERALAADGDFAEALVNLGELDGAEGLPELAESRFRSALAIDPDLAPARLDLARSLLHRGRAETGARREALWADARREYLHLLESSPELAEAHHDLAFMDHQSGRFERAAASYARAAELEPGYVEAHLGTCVSLARIGKVAEAEAACRTCASLQDGSARQPAARGPGLDARCVASLRALDGSRGAAAGRAR